jgi:hypothetical protein
VVECSCPCFGQISSACKPRKILCEVKWRDFRSDLIGSLSAELPKYHVILKKHRGKKEWFIFWSQTKWLTPSHLTFLTDKTHDNNCYGILFY